MPGLSLLDATIIGVYLLAMMALGFGLARRQSNQRDYYLAGGRMGWAPIGLSLVANQVSAISLIGAPAFIALREGGGMAWLQYELAVPLAMATIIQILLPVYRRSRGVTIFEYLEARFGPGTRRAMASVFLLSRALGASVALLATAVVASICLGLPLTWVILGVGCIAVLYTTLGGMAADIVSDLVQLAILWAGALVMLLVLWRALPPGGFAQVDPARLTIFRVATHGLGDGATFSVWPMLAGGFFLYFSYYGCDQTQAQRLLAFGRSADGAKALLLNALVRFPLVLTYCAVGLLLIPFLRHHPALVESLKGQPADALVPTFLMAHMPRGLLGLVIAGILAATMSSLDSAVNALSASTWSDFLLPSHPKLEHLSPRRQVTLSRVISAVWGGFIVLFALWLMGGHETLIELVNKIGSAFFGPVAGVFLLGILFPHVEQRGALLGLAAGLLINLMLWKGAPGVSWMWWNLIGCLASLLVGWSCGGRGPWRWGLVTDLPRDSRLAIRALLDFFLVVAATLFLLQLSLN